MEQSDEELLRGCQGGDSRAWETLVTRFQRLIFTIPRRAGLDEDMAAEVFQEVFTTLFEKINDIERPEKLQAWLVTTARRKTWRIINRERIFQRAKKPDDEDDAEHGEFENLPDAALLPDEVLMRLEEQHGVRTAVAALDERCRKLLTLLFYQDEPPPYANIAAAVGVPEGSIGPTRARCLGKLLKLLEK
ncbi:MAG: sigma-70 family RNA polymerase sigma factor [Pyrinomonadaceae bacterium]